MLDDVVKNVIAFQGYLGSLPSDKLYGEVGYPGSLVRINDSENSAVIWIHRDYSGHNLSERDEELFKACSLMVDELTPLQIFDRKPIVAKLGGQGLGHGPANTLIDLAVDLNQKGLASIFQSLADKRGGLVTLPDTAHSLADRMNDRDKKYVSDREQKLNRAIKLLEEKLPEMTAVQQQAILKQLAKAAGLEPLFKKAPTSSLIPGGV